MKFQKSFVAAFSSLVLGAMLIGAAGITHAATSGAAKSKATSSAAKNQATSGAAKARGTSSAAKSRANSRR